jgi:hypothetical protein
MAEKVNITTRFQVLTAASMKIPDFWDVTARRLVKFTGVSEMPTASVITTLIAKEIIIIL